MHTASGLRRLACAHCRFFAADVAANLYHTSAYYLAHMLAGGLLDNPRTHIISQCHTAHPCRKHTYYACDTNAQDGS